MNSTTAISGADGTRSIARVLGPFLAIVTTVIAVRAPAMGGLAADFFRSQLFIWFSGAGLIFAGLSIIASHQRWSSLAAAFISLFGWILLLRGLALMVTPAVYQQLSVTLGAIAVIRTIFGGIALMGLHLTYVGWKPLAQR